MNANLLWAATRHLSHRGPDAEGLAGWTVSGKLLKDDALVDQLLMIGLGHRRLAILDLTDAGRQPMQDQDGHWIVFNGEIYNYKEIREQLKSLGYRFETRTDTEVILKAYAAWGEDCVKKFNGMWAFAVFDSVKQCLFISRDRLGVKPLYYVRKENYFIFGSEIRALLCCPLIKPHILRERLIHYVIDRRIDDGPATIYKEIMELRGGHSMRVDVVTGDIEIWQFWELPEVPDLDLDDEAALDRYSELIEDSVRLRLQADVPVAITLSGGVDSSVVTLAASRINSAPVQTFTSRFPDNPEIDESNYASIVAQACRIKPNFIEPSIKKMIKDEPLLTVHQEMPYGSLSLYIHWLILAKIRSTGIPVVLSGQGGDETFLGYERYYVSALLAQYPHFFDLILSFFQASMNSRLNIGQLAAYVGFFSFPRLQRQVRLWKTKNIYHPDLLSQLKPPGKETVRNVRELQSSEILNNTLSSLLRYDDRTSGALGMETRLPFLDYRMVEFAYRLPLKFKIRNGWTKYLSRCYLGRHLPESIAWRKNKLGFNVPQSQWTIDLVEARGDHLQSIPFVKGLLFDGVLFRNIPLKQRWSVYNILQLADLLNWAWAE